MPGRRKRYCHFCRNQMEWIDYKDATQLKRYLGTWGKIKSGSESGTCAKHQRRVVEAIKRARFLAILPFTDR